MDVRNIADYVLSDVNTSTCDLPAVRDIFSVRVKMPEIVLNEQIYKHMDKILEGIRRLSSTSEQRTPVLSQLAQSSPAYKRLLSHLDQFVRHPKSGGVHKAVMADQDGVERNLSLLHSEMTETTAISQNGNSFLIRLIAQLSQDKAESSDEYWGFRGALEQFSHLLALQRAGVCVLRKVLMSKLKKGVSSDPRIEAAVASQLERIDKQVQLFYAEWKTKWDTSAGASVFSWDPNQLMKGVRVAATPHGAGGLAADGSDHIYFVARSSLYRLDAKGMAGEGKAAVELICGGFPDLIADYVASQETPNALSGFACGWRGDGGGVVVYSWETADLKQTDVKTRERKTAVVLGENPRGAVLKRQSVVCHLSGTVYCISLGTLYRVEPAASGWNKHEHCAGFTRDGCQIAADRSHVYVLDGEGRLWKTDLASERPARRKLVDDWHSEALISSPVDSAYLYSLWDKTLYAVDKETGAVTAVQSRKVWDHRITVMVAHRMSIYLFSDEGNVYRVKGLWAGPTAVGSQ